MRTTGDRKISLAVSTACARQACRSGRMAIADRPEQRLDGAQVSALTFGQHLAGTAPRVASPSCSRSARTAPPLTEARAACAPACSPSETTVLCDLSDDFLLGRANCGYLYHDPSSVDGTNVRVRLCQCLLAHALFSRGLGNRPRPPTPWPPSVTARKVRLAAGFALQPGCDLRPLLIGRRDPVRAILLPRLPRRLWSIAGRACRRRWTRLRGRCWRCSRRRRFPARSDRRTAARISPACWRTGPGARRWRNAKWRRASRRRTPPIPWSP